MTEFTEVVQAPNTAGSKLKEKYLAKQDPEKVKNYTEEANKLLDTFEKDIDDLIEKGKPPFATRNPSQSDNGILLNSSKLDSMIKDFLFSVIITDEADKRDLKIDIQATPVGIDSKTHQPIATIVIVCTFK